MLEYLREWEDSRLRGIESTRVECMDSNKWRLFCHGHPLEGVTRMGHQICVKYLDEWSAHLPDLGCMQWASLKQLPKWSHVDKTMDFAPQKQQLFDPKFETSLFDELTCVVKYIGDKVHD